MNLFVVIKRGLNRYKVMAVFLLMFFISIYAYYQEAVQYFGLYTTQLRSAYELCLIRSINTRFLMLILAIAGPLIVSFAFGDIYFDDFESNCIPFIFTREKKTKYHKINLLAVFILSFFITCIPFVINMILCLITYPLNGCDNMYLQPAYIIQFDKENILSYLMVFKPLIYNIISIVIISIIFALFACLTYALSMILKVNKYICTIISYGLYLGYNIFVEKIGFSNLSLFNYIDTVDKNNSFTIFISIIIVLIILIIILYNIGIRKED